MREANLRLVAIPGDLEGFPEPSIMQTPQGRETRRTDPAATARETQDRASLLPVVWQVKIAHGLASPRRTRACRHVHTAEDQQGSEDRDGRDVLLPEHRIQDEATAGTKWMATDACVDLTRPTRDMNTMNAKAVPRQPSDATLITTGRASPQFRQSADRAGSRGRSRTDASPCDPGSRQAMRRERRADDARVSLGLNSTHRLRITRGGKRPAPRCARSARTSSRSI